ncbi:protein NRT1/ PTR FAMILY 4.5 [Capsicum chacoense]|uniref:protein NRT1/ PTR FAMILY 4.5 n=1 Tax=Capsicum annuum TaxID=4072 RepID=UPI001FB075A2|nr:protein NRT1/ PTR FAMILY 4.5 [Capsicum annuum]KAF3616274.1 putative MLO-like protein 13-like [Capsicum annuum]KAF3616794.1 putative MLO-like protein 13-like [Capsicum annuum]
MEEGNNTEYNSVTSSKTKGKGGFRATSFIYGLLGLENMGFVTIMVSFGLYFSLVMGFDLTGSANTLTNLMGSTFLLSILGGFISDSYINRFHTVLIFGPFEILAFALITIQAHYKSLQPVCLVPNCISGGKAIFFYASLCCFALGSGGVKGALPALGADQFDQKDPKEAKALGRYFNLVLFSSVIGGAFGVTFVVYVSTVKAWWKGFLIGLVGTTFGFIVFAFGKPFFRLQTPAGSPLTRVFQVIVVAIKNRKLEIPKNSEELYEISDKECDSSQPKLAHTNQFRFFDKAAIHPKTAEPTPWTVCTVTQVEEVKVLTRMLPIIASTIIMNTCMAQLQTFSVAQGYRMNRFIKKFEVPAPSVPAIPLIFMCILIPIYDFFFVPFARKITKHPSGITQLQRVGVGLVLSIVSMAVAALVEIKRKHHSLKDPLKPIHLAWLGFQYAIFGIADMFTLVGLLEFFYKEAPVGMRSLSTSFTYISISLGYFLSSVLVDIINSVTKRRAPSKKGWLVGTDLDQNNLHLFYWFLAILSGLNFLNYLFWASWYKYKKDEVVEPKLNLGDSISLSNSVSRVALLKPSDSATSMPTIEESSNGPTEEANENSSAVPKVVTTEARS